MRLEDDGAIEARWEESESGPARKSYRLTAAGHAQRDRLHAEWAGFVAAVENVGRPDG